LASAIGVHRSASRMPQAAADASRKEVRRGIAAGYRDRLNQIFSAPPNPALRARPLHHRHAGSVRLYPRQSLAPRRHRHPLPLHLHHRVLRASQKVSRSRLGFLARTRRRMVGTALRAFAHPTAYFTPSTTAAALAIASAFADTLAGTAWRLSPGSSKSWVAPA